MRNRTSSLQKIHGYTRRQIIEQLAGVAAATAVGRSLAPLEASAGARKRVIVVGAGLGGLSAAYELVALGHDVTVLEAQDRPGGRVQTLRKPFSDGLYAEAGASRIPTSHDLTLAYARQFHLPLTPFEPVDRPLIRYAYGARAKVPSGAAFEWPGAVPVAERALTPAEVRRRYIDPLAEEIVDPFAADWIPSTLEQYDQITRDEHLRGQGVSDAALHMMNLGSTPVARIRSFLDVLREVAVNRELRRRAGTTEERLLKIDGGNDRLPRAFAHRLGDRIRYRCAARVIAQDSKTATVHFESAGSLHSASADYVVCALPFSVARHLEFLPALSAAKATAIATLPYHNVTRIYLQCRDRYWMHEGLSGFADTDYPMEIWDATYGQQGRRGILMAFIQGAKARELTQVPEAEQLKLGKAAVEKVFPGVVQAYERGVVKVWDEDRWARGAVAYLLPGQALTLDRHIAPPEGRVHFAGEHASSLRGWMQGAFESGRRVAREIEAR